MYYSLKTYFNVLIICSHKTVPCLQHSKQQFNFPHADNDMPLKAGENPVSRLYYDKLANYYYSAL